MKTTLFISAALLFALTSFAQTNAKNSEAVKDATTIGIDKSGNKVSNSGSTSSSTTVRSNTVPGVESKVASKTEKSKEAIAAEKQEITAKAKNKEQEARTAVSQHASASASVQSNSKVTVDEKGNKISEKASINKQATVPSAKVKATGSQLKEESKTAVAHTCKPKPASIKTNAKVKANTAIRIK